MSFALHNKEAKLLPSDTFLSRKNAQKCVCGQGSAPDPAAGAYSATLGPLAGNGGRAPGKGEGRGGEGRGGEGGVGNGGREGREGKGKGYPPNENPGYGLETTCRLVRRNDIMLLVDNSA